MKMTDLREIISALLLTVDEVWLSHGERLRSHSSITHNDVRLEEALFAAEETLMAAEDKMKATVVKRCMPRAVSPL
jgi:hypothetical protein